MNLKETTVKKNYVFEGKIIKVRRDDALLSNGKPCTREVVEHPGGACVLCVHEGKVALVKQFRYAYGEALYEIPAGKLEVGEDPLLAAKRELEEETGLVAKRLEHLFTLYPTPGYCNEKIYIYEAKEISLGKVHPDADEFLDIVYLPVEEVYAMIENGTVRDGKTIIAIKHYAIKNGLISR